MSFILEIIQGLGSIVISLIELYKWIIIIATIISWVQLDPYNPVVQFFYRVTQPAYTFINRFVNTHFNGLDLAPLILIIGLQILVVFLQASLRALLY